MIVHVPILFGTWQESEIPCKHAVSALAYKRIDPISVISEWFHVSKYRRVYEGIIFQCHTIPYGQMATTRSCTPLKGQRKLADQKRLEEEVPMSSSMRGVSVKLVLS